MPRLYSRITEGPGREGDQGQLFAMCDLIDDLLPRLPGRAVGILVENVFMNAYGDIKYFNGRLKAEAVLVDAADFGDFGALCYHKRCLNT